MKVKEYYLYEHGFWNTACDLPGAVRASGASGSAFNMDKNLTKTETNVDSAEKARENSEKSAISVAEEKIVEAVGNGKLFAYVNLLPGLEADTFLQELEELGYAVGKGNLEPHGHYKYLVSWAKPGEIG